MKSLNIEAGVKVSPGGQCRLLPDWKLVGCSMWQCDGYPTNFHGHCEKRGQKRNVPRNIVCRCHFHKDGKTLSNRHLELDWRMLRMLNVQSKQLESVHLHG
ncbi:hypothetical protein ACLKA7_002430 [Drosophila subpalustris]